MLHVLGQVSVVGCDDVESVSSTWSKMCDYYSADAADGSDVAKGVILL